MTPCLNATIGERLNSAKVSFVCSSQFLLNGIEMTSDNANIFIFGVCQLFSSSATPINQCKRAFTADLP
jgi:hypothetical protein